MAIYFYLASVLRKELPSFPPGIIMLAVGILETERETKKEDFPLSASRHSSITVSLLDLIPILLKLFQKFEEKGKLPNSFIELRALFMIQDPKEYENLSAGVVIRSMEKR